MAFLNADAELRYERNEGHAATAAQAVARFKALDSWRGICALLVATYHYPATFVALEIPLVRAGWIFVDFFFVLSGLVITHRYLMLGKRISLGKFLQARVRRLYPLHVLTLVLVLAMALVIMVARYLLLGVVKLDGVGADPSTFCGMLLAHAFLLQGFTSFDAVGFNVPSWSISVEFWTNVAFVLMARCGLFKLPVLMVVAVAAMAFLAEQAPYLYLGGDGVVNATRSVLGFAFGAMTYLVLTLHIFRIKGLLLGTAAELVSLALVAGAVTLGQLHEHLWLLPVLFSVCVLVFAMEQGYVTRLLLQPIFQRAGMLSYAIYLVHFFWVSLFYAASTALEKLPTLSRFASGLGSAWPLIAYCLFLLAVWISASLLTKIVADRYSSRFIPRVFAL